MTQKVINQYGVSFLQYISFQLLSCFQNYFFLKLGRVVQGNMGHFLVFLKLNF